MATGPASTTEPTSRELRHPYDTNRTDSYYRGRHPTERQAETMRRLARGIHEYATDRIREGGVRVCDPAGTASNSQ